jgi:hypothetical protein
VQCSRTSSWRRAAATVSAALALVGAGGCIPATDAATVPPNPSSSRRQLEELVVAAPGTMRGYSRDRFPHWDTTGENCDIRDRVLRRDGRDVRLRGCNVVGGRWLSPYDNRVLATPSGVDIDHMVPLANAWRSGAARWSEASRGAFANDVRRPQLLAVSRASNRAKGDQDPAQWKPRNRDYWCRYAQNWITVKHHWQLTVTRTEKSALFKMLETCRWPSRTPTSPPTSSPRRAG